RRMGAVIGDGAAAQQLDFRPDGEAGDCLGRTGASAGGGGAVLETAGTDRAFAGLRSGQNFLSLGRTEPAGESGAASRAERIGVRGWGRGQCAPGDAAVVDIPRQY